MPSTFALGAAITGLAGGLISTHFVIYPQMGLPYTIIAFCVVVLGGMGYIPGALVGGLLLGVIQSADRNLPELRSFHCHNLYSPLHYPRAETPGHHG